MAISLYEVPSAHPLILSSGFIYFHVYKWDAVLYYSVDVWKAKGELE